MINKKVTFKYIGDGNKYFIDGVRQPTLDLIKGETYIFDWSLAPTHPLRFSETSNGTHNNGIEFIDGVIKNDNEYFTSIIVPQNIETLYYYCKVHSGMGGKINLVNARAVRQTNFPKAGDNEIPNAKIDLRPIKALEKVSGIIFIPDCKNLIPNPIKDALIISDKSCLASIVFLNREFSPT